MAKIETTLTAEQVKMFESLIGLVPVVTVGKRSGNTVSTEVPMAEMPLAAWTKILMYGAQRVFNDAIGGSDTDQAAKVDKVRAMIADFKNGVVGRQAAEGVDAVTAGIRTIMRSKLKAALEAQGEKGKAKWAEFDGKEAKEQGPILDAQFAKQPEAFQKKVRETIEAKLAAKRAEKEALGSLGVEFDL